MSAAPITGSTPAQLWNPVGTRLPATRSLASVATVQRRFPELLTQFPGATVGDLYQAVPLPISRFLSLPRAQVATLLSISAGLQGDPIASPAMFGMAVGLSAAGVGRQPVTTWLQSSVAQQIHAEIESRRLTLSFSPRWEREGLKLLRDAAKAGERLTRARGPENQVELQSVALRKIFDDRLTAWRNQLARPVVALPATLSQTQALGAGEPPSRPQSLGGWLGRLAQRALELVSCSDRQDGLMRYLEQLRGELGLTGAEAETAMKKLSSATNLDPNSALQRVRGTAIGVKSTKHATNTASAAAAAEATLHHNLNGTNTTSNGDALTGAVGIRASDNGKTNVGAISPDRDSYIASVVFQGPVTINIGDPNPSLVAGLKLKILKLIGLG